MYQALSRYDNPAAQGENPFTVANAITVAGYGAGLAWIAGGPSYLAIASIIADEVDGYVARALHEETHLGSSLDWSTDLILTSLSLLRINAPIWTLIPAAIWQTYAREHSIYPPVGSLRAALMIIGVIQDAYKER